MDFDLQLYPLCHWQQSTDDAAEVDDELLGYNFQTTNTSWIEQVQRLFGSPRE